MWAVDEPPVDMPSFDADLYPEVCLRGLAGFIPGLRAYVDGEIRTTTDRRRLLREHEEPAPDRARRASLGYYVNGAFAGFRLMAAEAAGRAAVRRTFWGSHAAFVCLGIRPARYVDPSLRVASRGGGSI